MIPYQVIRNKRDGNKIDKKILKEFVLSYVNGEIPDYQMSAFLMAVYFQGMDSEEILSLTRAYIASGETMNFNRFDFPTSDKHSTGGVGDKVSLVLAPLVASCGVGVPMISGRGLGHTGGTLDKLESIPGFVTDLDIERCCELLSEIGLFVASQTAKMVPADKKIYALRDVTATVESIPLIVASIMSKKLAEGAGSLVLDVKFGNGAFMKNIQDAQTLAKSMVDVGNLYGVPTVALLTDMNQPLGEYVGNALEVVESIKYLRTELIPPDFHTVTMTLGAIMLTLSGVVENILQGKQMLEKKLQSGEALEKFAEFISAQGGDANVINNTDLLPTAPECGKFPASADGFIASFDTTGIGMLGVEMGAGRKKMDDIVDPRVGFRFLKKTGDKVCRGETVAIIYGADISQVKFAISEMEKLVEFSSSPVEKPRAIRLLIDKTRIIQSEQEM
ncbi:thymidine phosphorylase, partial [bacterium]